VHQNRRDASDLRGLERAENGIAQETLAKTPVLMGLVNGEAPRNITGTWSGMLRRTRPGASLWATAPFASAG